MTRGDIRDSCNAIRLRGEVTVDPRGTRSDVQPPMSRPWIKCGPGRFPVFPIIGIHTRRRRSSFPSSPCCYHLVDAGDAFNDALVILQVNVGLRLSSCYHSRSRFPLHPQRTPSPSAVYVHTPSPLLILHFQGHECSPLHLRRGRLRAYQPHHSQPICSLFDEGHPSRLTVRVRVVLVLFISRCRRRECGFLLAGAVLVVGADVSEWG
ncbi:hypothetical protein R3P38DRAFT_804458 [Favolaschia claudopus]|uniref:Uncharacterized protein n=1 Tax=Favolaschia claudopus TaxID=2862362 RepID=A0AAV9Z224_9AGAR